MRYIRLLVFRWRYLALFAIALSVSTILFVQQLESSRNINHRRSRFIKDDETAKEVRVAKVLFKAVQSNIPGNLSGNILTIFNFGNLDNASFASAENIFQRHSSVRFTGQDYDFSIVAIVDEGNISLQQRMHAKVKKEAKPRLILSWNAGHSGENLGGCPDWNCKFSTNPKLVNEADAILVAIADKNMPRRPDQYVVYISQESPLSSEVEFFIPNYFNFSLNYRRDSLLSSPYGYTVQLAAESQMPIDYASLKKTINGKQKAVAWFVSHCETASQRQAYVEYLKTYIKVDIYGYCGPLMCPIGASCEKMLTNDYHFYIAFENAVCTDYVTEKLWNLGFGMDIVPIVLKRSIVEKYVPPNSFIAVDDFLTVKDLADYLQQLMEDKAAYMRYFEWRREYRVVFLNGRFHDILERPWGFCQLCRVLWQNPRPHHVIDNFKRWWADSCEYPDGELVQRILSSSVMNPKSAYVYNYTFGYIKNWN